MHLPIKLRMFINYFIQLFTIYQAIKIKLGPGLRLPNLHARGSRRKDLYIPYAKHAFYNILGSLDIRDFFIRHGSFDPF